MISPKTKELLEAINTSPYGRALKEYLDEELARIDTVKGISSLDEALGREKAVDIINKIFYFVLKETKEVDKSKTSYR